MQSVFFGRIQRYVLLELMFGLFITLGIVLIAIIMVDMVEQLRTVGSRADLTIFDALKLTLFKVPNLIQETLPFATLVGSILAYSKINRTSELSAIRAAGVSAWRFLGPVVLVGVTLGLSNMFVLDPLSTSSQSRYNELRDSILKEERAAPIESQDGVWLRQGDETTQSVIHGETIESTGQKLNSVEIFVFARNGPEMIFQRRIDAQSANLRPGFWQLENVVETAVEQEPVAFQYLALPTTIKADTLLNRFASARTISFYDLPAFIDETEQAGLENGQYILKLHSLMATPVLLTAMGLIGAVVCLRLRRSGGVTGLLVTGAGAGIGLFFITQLAKGLSQSGATPPEVAAWCPPLCALFAVMTVIAYAEDG